MTDPVIDGRTVGRRQLLQMLRDVCTEGMALCDKTLGASERWKDRADSVIRSCVRLQRGLIGSHPAVADELHMLSTEIQIALAARPHESLFAARLQKVKDVLLRLQYVDIGGDRPGEKPADAPTAQQN